MIEACRWTGTSYLAGVQWHPEFHDRTRADLLDDDPLLADFLRAASEARDRRINPRPATLLRA